MMIGLIFSENMHSCVRSRKRKHKWQSTFAALHIYMEISVCW